MAIKLLTAMFVLVAIRRVVVRYRRGGGLALELVFWLMVFSGIGIVVFIPRKTDQFAQWLGVSSGFNALTFIAISGLLYAVYRLLSRLQIVERDVTKLVRLLALDKPTRVREIDTMKPPPPAG